NQGGSPGTPTGTVQFFDGVTPITCDEGSTSTQTLNGSGVATCTTSGLSPGAGKTIKAQYNGDGNFDTSFGTVSQTVTACSINPIVTSTADSGVGTLRDAVTNICTAPNNNVTFNLGAGPHTITLTSGALVVAKNINITNVVGAGNGAVTVSGGGTSRIFTINSGITATIDNLTITNGLVSGASPGGAGGAIYNDHGTLTIKNSTVSGSTANPGGG